ncbi:MAG: HEAT repeat domain-containing protein [Asgard group archaeon]|nr:HEAT repeat domain-containing protein [Asgard group archaeon]
MSISRLTRELRDLNPETRIKAAMNLGEMKAAETLPTLLNVFKKETDEKVRSVMAEALASFTDFDDVINALKFAVDNDKSELVRISAEWSLKQISKSRGYADLQSLLDDMEE